MKKMTGLGVAFLCLAILTGCGSTDTSKLEEDLTKLEKSVDTLNDRIGELRDQAAALEEEDVLEGKVKVPDTYLKSQKEVEEAFEKVGLKVEFVVTNFDSKVKTDKKKIAKGDCAPLDDDSGAEYFDRADAGSDYGYYADEGATITVGYSDHDFDGTKTEESSTKESSKESSSESSTSQTKESEAPATPESSTAPDTGAGVSDSEIEGIKTYKDYLDVYSKILTTFLTDYENLFKDTVLYDETAFAEMKKEYETSLEEQKKQYEDLGTKALVGKESLVSFLKNYRDGLNSYIDSMSSALN